MALCRLFSLADGSRDGVENGCCCLADVFQNVFGLDVFIFCENQRKPHSFFGIEPEPGEDDIRCTEGDELRCGRIRCLCLASACGEQASFHGGICRWIFIRWEQCVNGIRIFFCIVFPDERLNRRMHSTFCLGNVVNVRHARAILRDYRDTRSTFDDFRAQALPEFCTRIGAASFRSMKE